MEKLEVSESFVREAYKAACSEWKERLEKEFPSVFKKGGKVMAMKEVATFNRTWPTSSVKVLDNGTVVIPLPNCNKEWTFAAWKLAREICEAFPEEYYPYHDLPQSAAKNITLKFRAQ